MLYLVSFICYILSFFVEGILLLFLSIPFLLLVCAAVHELGHCIGCYLNSNKITSVATPLFTYHGGKIEIANDIVPKSYCSFVKRENDSLVYISGPLTSLGLAVLTGSIYYMFESSSLAVFALVAIFVFLINMIPGKNGDLTKFIKEKNK